MPNKIQPPPVPTRIFTDNDIDSWLYELERSSNEREQQERVEIHNNIMMLKEVYGWYYEENRD